MRIVFARHAMFVRGVCRALGLWRTGGATSSRCDSTAAANRSQTMPTPPTMPWRHPRCGRQGNSPS